MPHLIVREPGQVTFSLPLRKAIRAGRHEQNDLVLDDHRVSRQHLEIAPDPEGWTAKDLGSTHGTLVNGAKTSLRRLEDGDRLQIGGVLLTFLAEDESQEIVHQQPTTRGAPQDSTDARRLRLFYEVSQAIGSLGDTDELLARILAAILDVLGCERALVGLGEAAQDSLRRITRARGSAPGEDVVVSRTLLDAMLTRRERVILRSDPAKKKAPPTVVRERIRSAMGVPLEAGPRLLGFLYVDDRTPVARFSPEDLDFLSAIGHLTAAALESAERFQQATAKAEALAAEGATAEIIGMSSPMQQLKTEIRKYGAAPGTNVLIRGESGTGKELVARALHVASPRAEQPLVTLNCAAIPETMIESELFGYEKGAFTGAIRDKKGKFALADRGTLFLDEIGDLDLAAQAKLLRALQEGEIQPLGSEKTLRVNVRVFAATHKDLRREIEEKRFREDLYYRLSVVEIEVPPLRERGEDIELLARTLLKSAAVNVGKRLSGFTPEALKRLGQHRWPGNVRELKNEVERAALITERELIEVSDLSSRLRGGGDRAAAAPTMAAPTATLAEQFAALEPTEQRLIEEALKAARGNLSEAARLLGITRIMIKRRVDRFGLSGDGE